MLWLDHCDIPNNYHKSVPTSVGISITNRKCCIPKIFRKIMVMVMQIGQAVTIRW